MVSYRTRQAHVGENYTRCGLSKHKRPGGLGLTKTTEVKNEAPEHGLLLFMETHNKHRVSSKAVKLTELLQLTVVVYYKLLLVLHKLIHLTCCFSYWVCLYYSCGGKVQNNNF